MLKNLMPVKDDLKILEIFKKNVKINKFPDTLEKITKDIRLNRFSVQQSAPPPMPHLSEKQSSSTGLKAEGTSSLNCFLQKPFAFGFLSRTPSLEGNTNASYQSWVVQEGCTPRTFSALGQGMLCPRSQEGPGL